MDAPPTPFEVRIWCRHTTPPASEREALHTTLTVEEERNRTRFHHADDADRFLVGRGTLRRELGRMLGVSPRDVPLAASPHGKLQVVGGTPHVNVSHSGDVVLIAITTGAPLGVDVEQIDPRFADRTELDAYFSPAEIAELGTLPHEHRLDAFFHTWTSRESLMKLVGLGFRLPRESFDVSTDPRRPPALVGSRTPLLPAAPLSLVSIAVPHAHVAVLAIAAAAGTFRVSPVYDGA